jgi:RNA-dependent RNA polymerase
MKRGIPTAWNGNSSPSNGATVEAALSYVDLSHVGLPGLTDPSEELMEEMTYLLNAYCEQLLIIGQAHTMSKNKNIHVSEAELVSGTIMATWSDHHRRRNAVSTMNLQVSMISSPHYGFFNDIFRRKSSFAGSGKNSRGRTREH